MFKNMFKTDNAHFQLFRIFYLLAVAYSTAFHFFYQAPALYIAFWGVQFLLIHVIHNMTQDGKRWILLYYPIMTTLSFVFMKYTLVPYFTWVADPLLHSIDKSLLGETPAVSLTKYAELNYTEVLSAAYLCFLPILYGSCFFYLYSASIFKVRRFYNGLFSLYAIGFSLYILFPAMGPYLFLKNTFSSGLPSGDIGLLSHSLIMQGTNYMDAFPCLYVAISLYIALSLLRDAKYIGMLLIPVVILISIAALYLRYYYFIDVIIGIILSLLCFFFISGGFKKVKYIKSR